MRKIVLPFLTSLILVLVVCGFVSAQENEVCLVYFSGYACGDECGLTDTFMDGLVNEYSLMLTTIKYYVDASQENTDLFEAYRRTYGLPSGVPLVLFGKDDYLLGKDNIYGNTESRILSFLGQNGTNCPLESGYVPPGDLDPGSLPGQVEVFENEGVGEELEGEDDLEDEEEGTEGGAAPGGDGMDIGSIIEDVVESEYFPVWMLVAAILIILIAGIGLAFGRKGGRKRK